MTTTTNETPPKKRKLDILASDEPTDVRNKVAKNQRHNAATGLIENVKEIINDYAKAGTPLEEADAIHVLIREIDESVRRDRAIKEKYLSKEGPAFTCGMADDGQCGHGDEKLDPIETPAEIRPKLSAVAAGGLHTVGVTYSGKLYSWGNGQEGQLGLDKYSAMRSQDIANVKGDLADVADVTEDFVYKPTEVQLELGALQNQDFFIQVAAGACQTLALTCFGDLFACGGYKNTEGKFFKDFHAEKKDHFAKVTTLGNRVTQMDCGTYFSAAVQNDGEAFTWGVGDLGYLARPVPEWLEKPFEEDFKDKEKYPNPEKAYRKKLECFLKNEAENHAAYLKPSPVTWSMPNQKRPVLYVACGNYHLMVIASDRKLYTAGMNNYGQLCLGDKENRKSLTLVSPLSDNFQIQQVAGGEHHSLIMTTDGDIFTAGRADYGQLGYTTYEVGYGHSENLPSKPILTEFEKDEKVKQISCGDHHNLALTQKGNVYGWGSSDNGVLGLGNVGESQWFPKRIHLNGRKVKQIAGGAQFSVFICEDEKSN